MTTITDAMQPQYDGGKLTGYRQGFDGGYFIYDASGNLTGMQVGSTWYSADYAQQYKDRFYPDTQTATTPTPTGTQGEVLATLAPTTNTEVSSGNYTVTPATSPTTSTSPTTPPTTTTPEAQQAIQMTDQQFQQLLNSTSLTDDQKAALKAVYNAASTHDQEQYQQLVSAFQSATQFSDPYFKAQVRLALDALDRSFNGIEGDLSYNSTKLQSALADLQRDIASSKDFLSFQQLQELKGLERAYTKQLDTTRDNMATRGFTQSSVRSKAEQLLSDTFGDLRESSNRSFTQQNQNLTNQLTDAQQNTQSEIQRLQQLAAEGKLDLVHKAEAQLGTSNLPTTYQQYELGGVSGDLARQQTADALSFAQSYVF
jgi:hypothetical protein